MKEYYSHYNHKCQETLLVVGLFGNIQMIPMTSIHIPPMIQRAREGCYSAHSSIPKV